MDTKILSIDRDHPDPVLLEQGAAVIRRGGLVAFPTETVYGLGANGLNAQAVSGIYRAKGRPSDNPLILHIAEQGSVSKLAKCIPSNAARLMERFWPGPLTIVLERTSAVPDIVTGGLDTVAVRLPDSTVARDLIRLAGVPVAAPSANTSGRPSPTSAQAVADDLMGRVDVILDAGPCDIGVESTVIDCTTPVPTLLRPGGVTLEQLIDVLGEVEVDPALAAADVIPRSPGMKYTHYAPSAPMILVEAPFPHVERIIVRETKTALAAGRRVGAVISDETAAGLDGSVIVSAYGPRRDKHSIAMNLYSALRYFDTNPVDVIYAEGIDESGIGLAVMNRLRKAAGYQIINS
jgi:L-threonylcarbamoyladenylate synthase